MAEAYRVLRDKGTLRDHLDLVTSFDDFAPTVDLEGHYELEAPVRHPRSGKHAVTPLRRRDCLTQALRSGAVPISVGDKVPDVEVHTLGPEGPTPVRTGEALGTGKVVLFAVPGAFTPGCSKIHLPGFVAGAGELKAKGVDHIACIAVNDPWVMDAWSKAQGADEITMLADGSGRFAEAMGLGFDGSAFGLGKRSQRYAAVIEEGVFTSLDVEASPASTSARASR